MIKELYPEYYDTFVQLVNGKETYFGNIIVGKDGVEAVVPIELDEEEQEQLKKSATLLKELNTMIKTEHGVK